MIVDRRVLGATVQDDHEGGGTFDPGRHVTAGVEVAGIVAGPVEVGKTVARRGR
jgi:hypothetical protein